jgi:hypothetical protein
MTSVIDGSFPDFFLSFFLSFFEDVSAAFFLAFAATERRGEKVGWDLEALKSRATHGCWEV